MERPLGERASHETIDTAIHALPRGELPCEPISYLRQDKPMHGRKPKDCERRRKICAMIYINERPEEIEGRLVLGHGRETSSRARAGPVALAPWLKGPSALVDAHAGRKPSVVANTFTGTLNDTPASLRRPIHATMWRGWMSVSGPEPEYLFRDYSHCHCLA
jgi:hypothetical protein